MDKRDHILTMRSCLHPSYDSIYNDLFLYVKDSNERKELDSVALSYMISHLNTGKSFCQTLALTQRYLHSYIEQEMNRMLQINRTRQDFMANGWLATQIYLGHPYRLKECHTMDSMIEGNHTKKLGNVDSETLRCMNKIRKRAIFIQMSTLYDDEL